MGLRHSAKTNLKYSVLSRMSWHSVLTAKSQMLVRGHYWINTVHMKSLLQGPGGKEWVGKRDFSSIWIRVMWGHIFKLIFFSFLFFYFATRCPETQWLHLSLSSCLIWTNLSYLPQPKHRTRLHKSFIKYFWTINKCARNCSQTISQRSCLLQTGQSSLWKWSKKWGLT